MIITDEKLLRVKCEDVKLEEIDSLRKDLDFNLSTSAVPGIGLAAPQIGIAKKMAIIRLNDIKLDLVNCYIANGYNKTIFEGEGCLSFPGRVEKTLRYSEIEVRGNLVKPYSFVATGLLAVAIAHELDHLNGILLPDIAIKETAIKEDVKVRSKLRPNDKCHCGSSLKYKKCCKLKE